ncbi:MAG: hypothetical protein U9R38_05990 [Candidatus Margulisiibacteriota bacterium]|nr:hypothetical protein [Candidatus Margulisiibacteriota bacterium]
MKETLKLSDLKKLIKKEVRTEVSSSTTKILKEIKKLKASPGMRTRKKIFPGMIAD